MESTLSGSIQGNVSEKLAACHLAQEGNRDETGIHRCDSLPFLYVARGAATSHYNPSTDEGARGVPVRPSSVDGELP